MWCSFIKVFFVRAFICWLLIYTEVRKKWMAYAYESFAPKFVNLKSPTR